MKKRILSLILMITLLMSFNFSLVNAVTFSDVDSTHWAESYINQMRRNNLLNGYEDGTFRPENEVTTGEYIKILAMALYPNYEYKAPEEGHWARPYLNIVDRTLLSKNAYNDERLDKPIPRIEAAVLACRLHLRFNLDKEIATDQTNLKMFSDESLIVEEIDRIMIDNSISYGIINGFEDGTFRPNDTLTRAEACKIIMTAMYN